MGLWSSIIGSVAGLLLGNAPTGSTLPVRAPRAQVTFTIAAIALAAKMAAADGEASAAEFATFERLFRVDDGERANAARFYRMAQRSTAGFEAYATQAAGVFGAGAPVLEDLLEALLLIAKADGFEASEFDFLDDVAARLGFDAAGWARIRARHDPSAEDPRVVLGVDADADAASIRAAWLGLVKRHHPDRLRAAGTPPEFIRVADERMAAINGAYASLNGKSRA